MDLIGARFGSFQVIRLIGRGAVARVFLASDGEALKAVKLFPPEQHLRAARELEFGRGLQHEHLNPVDDSIELGGFPGVIMPFVQGEILSRWNAPEGSPRRFLQAILGIIDGLGYLHERDIVHRDVKPENVLVDASGHATLLDYDLATRPLSLQDRSSMAGTIAFLSPEQGRAEAVTPASDMYSVGVLLYWGLSGQVPFSGDPLEVMKAHQNSMPAPLGTLVPGLACFEPLLDALLAKDPAGRPDSAAVMAEVLRQLPQVQS